MVHVQVAGILAILMAGVWTSPGKPALAVELARIAPAPGETALAYAIRVARAFGGEVVQINEPEAGEVLVPDLEPEAVEVEALSPEAVAPPDGEPVPELTDAELEALTAPDPEG